MCIILCILLPKEVNCKYLREKLNKTDLFSNYKSLYTKTGFELQLTHIHIIIISIRIRILNSEYFFLDSIRFNWMQLD